MGAYSMPFAQAFWQFPVATALALLPAFRRRAGMQDTGPDATDRAARRAKRKMEKALADKFNIIDEV